MNQKAILASLTVILTVGFGSFFVMAQDHDPKIEGEPIVESDSVEMHSDFLSFTGTVSKMEDQMDSRSWHVENDESNLMIFPVSEEVLILSATGEFISSDTIEMGARVNVYYDRHKPMPLIYPATITPDFVIVNDQEYSQVKVAKFDSHLVSLDNDLKLQLDEDTIIVNEKGEKRTEAELSDRELIVFYTTSTRSIPAQTTPSKVIIINRAE